MQREKKWNIGSGKWFWIYETVGDRDLEKINHKVFPCLHAQICIIVQRPWVVFYVSVIRTEEEGSEGEKNLPGWHSCSSPTQECPHSLKEAAIQSAQHNPASGHYYLKELHRASLKVFKGSLNYADGCGGVGSNKGSWFCDVTNPPPPPVISPNILCSVGVRCMYDFADEDPLFKLPGV